MKASMMIIMFNLNAQSLDSNKQELVQQKKKDPIEWRAESNNMPSSMGSNQRNLVDYE